MPSPDLAKRRKHLWSKVARLEVCARGASSLGLKWPTGSRPKTPARPLNAVSRVATFPLPPPPSSSPACRRRGLRHLPLPCTPPPCISDEALTFIVVVCLERTQELLQPRSENRMSMYAQSNDEAQSLEVAGRKCSLIFVGVLEYHDQQCQGRESEGHLGAKRRHLLLGVATDRHAPFYKAITSRHTGHRLRSLDRRVWRW